MIILHSNLVNIQKYFEYNQTQFPPGIRPKFFPTKGRATVKVPFDFLIKQIDQGDAAKNTG